MINFTMLCHNRPRLTKQALESLKGTPDITVTVLDDVSTDPDMCIDSWLHGGGYNSALLVNTESQGTGMARNKVIHASERFFGRGDYLYLSDNDVFFKPEWLHKLIEAYEIAWGHGFRVVGGYNHPFHIPVSTVWIESFVPGGPMGFAPCACEVNALATQSMLMRWEVWDKYGPFCQTPVGKVCQSEDVDFTNRIKADGGRIGVAYPALLVNTGITNSFGEKIPGWEMVLKEAPQGVIVE